MYLYLQPHGGLNDMLSVIQRCIIYCIQYNRILLVDTEKSSYKINFSDYFHLNNNNVITDIKIIKDICNNNNNSVYPSYLTNKLNNVLNNEIPLLYSKQGYTCEGNILQAPNHHINETIIVFAQCGYGIGYLLFKELKIVNENIKKICHQRYELLVKPYLCIQIRNTDYKCNYTKLYEDNKTLIQSYNSIYIATDDKEAIEYFKMKELQVTNFTTFPINKSLNLHDSDIPADMKIIDLLSDIYIIGLSDKLLSYSGGGFINLVRHCNDNKKDLIEQFKLETNSLDN